MIINFNSSKSFDNVDDLKLIIKMQDSSISSKSVDKLKELSSKIIFINIDNILNDMMSGKIPPNEKILDIQNIAITAQINL